MKNAGSLAGREAGTRNAMNPGALEAPEVAVVSRAVLGTSTFVLVALALACSRLPGASMMGLSAPRPRVPAGAVAVTAAPAPPAISTAPVPAPQVAPVLQAPSAPLVPATAATAAAPSLPPPIAPEQIAGGPEPRPADAEPLPDGWTARPTAVERPTVTVRNFTTGGDRVTLRLLGVGGEFTFDCTYQAASQSIPPGEYRYELRAGYYYRTGRLDQYGVLRCRRYREYEIDLVDTTDDDAFSVDLGDR